ncbi:MAG TPA: hypothetical protein VN688_06160 [Gemmataceae bacterium]|nr:hypothetical protein [Gemmataceae bacterium]
MWRSLVFALTCLILAGCSNQPGNNSSAQSGDALDVYEAVFRYRLQKYPADVRAYLAVDGQDVSEELLGRLRRDWPNLKPASEEPKEKGLRVYVEKLKWVNRSTAELHAGWWSPSKFAGDGYSGDHRVVRDGRQWRVEKVTNEIMS